MCACIPNGGGEGIIMQSGAVYVTILCYTNPGTLRLTCAHEEGSMAYRRPSFGPSDEGYRSEYDITMTASMSLTSPDHYLQADSLL